MVLQTPDIAAVQTQAVRDFAATLTAEAPTSSPTEAPIELATAKPTATAEISTPTSTPEPTATPTPVPATATPVPPVPPTATPKPIGTLKVDHWLFEITEVRSDPGKDTSRQNVVLLGYLTNEGNQNDTFVAFATIMLRDPHGREYEDDRPATWRAQDKYGAESGASMNPGSKEYIAIAFDVVASEKTFTIIPGSLVASWSGNITSTLP